MEVHSRRLGLQRENSVGRAVFSSKGQACRGTLLNEDLPDQKCRRLGCRRCASSTDDVMLAQLHCQHSNFPQAHCQLNNYRTITLLMTSVECKFRMQQIC